MRIRIFLLPAVAVATLLLTEHAEAQASRTWVSGLGDDANPCSRTAPCKTFPGAISKTAANGEINCIDSGGFGAVTITKSITINCESVIGGVLAAGTNGVIVNGDGIVVVLRGLDIDGTVTGLNGIRFLNGSALHVQNCLIRGFRAAGPNGNGISFAPTAANATLFVSDSMVSGNANGVRVQPSGAGSARAVFSNVRIDGNASAGLRAESTAATSTVSVTLANSVISGNGTNGMMVIAPAGAGAAQAMLQQVTIAANGNIGLRGDGSRATIRAAESVITGNDTGSRVVDGARFLSYGNNRIDGNTDDGPSPTIIGEK